MRTSDSFCFIPAKAASKRLKKKNIKLLNGKRMIEYSINAALKSKLFDNEIIVSTESEEVKKIALDCGAKVPYKRKKKLALDPYGVVDVTIDFFNLNQKYTKFKNIIWVLPTSPLVESHHIIEAHSKFSSSKSNVLMAVTENDHSAFRSLTISKNKINPVFPDLINKKSQELEKTYRINGAIIIMDVKEFLKHKTYLINDIECYEMPKENSIDIDTSFDFKLAEFLMKNK